MQRPLIVLFPSVPGSGKTTFAKQLAKKLDGVVLSSDAVRLSMWGSREEVDRHRQGDEARLYSNQLVFGALTYAARQILSAGHSVLYDSVATYRHERQEKYDMAAEIGADVVLVDIKVPREVALQRMQQREATHDQRQFHEEKAIGVLDHFTEVIEAPTDDEKVIYLDGQASFDEQYAQFTKSCQELFP